MEAGGRAAVERGLEFGILGPLQVAGGDVPEALLGVAGPEFEAARAQGRVLTLDAAIAEALEASV